MTNDSVEVTRVSSRGIWIKARGQKFFLSYYDFPWFKDKTVQAVLQVEERAPNQFHWPQIGVNLDLDMIRHPQYFPPQQSALA